MKEIYICTMAYFNMKIYNMCQFTVMKFSNFTAEKNL